jgi:hypothetical protein
MALINCKECGKEVSDKATACPNCGAPIDNYITATKDVKGSTSSEPPKTYTGFISLVLGVAGLFMPYFASVFIVPATFIMAVIAITKKQAIIGIIAIILSISGLNRIIDTSNQIQKFVADPFSNQTTEPASLKITYSEYQQIENGMSYQEVVNIIGEDGEELSNTVLGDLTILMYQWINSDFSNMTATFENDKLTSKSQFGLN